MTQSVAVAVVEDLDPNDIEEQIFAHRLTGRSERWISKRFGVTCKEVREICARLLPTFDQQTRQEEAALEIARMNALYTRHFPTAMKGDLAATAVVIRLSERKGELMGLDKAPERVSTPTLPLVEERRQTSTERIQAAIERLCAQGPNQPQIEGPT